MLHRLVWVYTYQNATVLEITCHGSNAWALHHIHLSNQFPKSIVFEKVIKHACFIDQQKYSFLFNCWVKAFLFVDILRNVINKLCLCKQIRNCFKQAKVVRKQSVLLLIFPLFSIGTYLNCSPKHIGVISKDWNPWPRPGPPDKSV